MAGPDDGFTTDEVAYILRCYVDTVRDWCRDKIIPSSTTTRRGGIRYVISRTTMENIVGKTIMDTYEPGSVLPDDYEYY